MTLHFTKMHGLGNDFVVLDGTRSPIDLDESTARKIADRHFGVGCDQILVVEPPRRHDADFTYRIFNADGSESGQCGNGARCFMHYVRASGLTRKPRIVVDIQNGQMVLEALGGGQFSAALGVPIFDPARVPLQGFEPALRYRLTGVSGQTVEFSAVSMGNPHAVIRVANAASAPVERIGPALVAHQAFPEGVNAGFMEVVARDHIRLRVFERGAGETLACGSGATAAVVTGIMAGDLDPMVRVDLPGGTAHVQWQNEHDSAILIGPAERVFDGRLQLSMPHAQPAHGEQRPVHRV